MYICTVENSFKGQKKVMLKIYMILNSCLGKKKKEKKKERKKRASLLITDKKSTLLLPVKEWGTKSCAKAHVLM